MIGVDPLLQAGKQGPRFVQLARPVNIESETGRWIDEAEVLGDTEIRAEIQFLKDDSDAVMSRVANRLEPYLFAVEEQPPRGRRDHASENLHQGRLASSVLTDKHVDGAPPNLEVDVTQRDRSWKNPSDPFCSQNHARLSRKRRFAHGDVPFPISMEMGVMLILVDADPCVAAP